MPEGESKTSEKPKGAEKEEPTYTVERLIDESQGFLGVPSHVAAGAFHGVGKKNLTLEEAEAILDKWRKAPVKEG